MLTYQLCDSPTLPESVERDGKTYERRAISARNVREGDLIAFVDVTGPSGTVGTFGIGEVWIAESMRTGYGRHYVPVKQRRVLTVRDWRGTLFPWQVPTAPFRYGHAELVNVWRLVTGKPA